MTTIYSKPRWNAYFKNGVHKPCIVYASTKDEAVRQALAEYRKSMTMVSEWPASAVVDNVELIDAAEVQNDNEVTA